MDKDGQSVGPRIAGSKPRHWAMWMQGLGLAPALFCLIHSFWFCMVFCSFPTLCLLPKIFIIMHRTLDKLCHIFCYLNKSRKEPVTSRPGFMASYESVNNLRWYNQAGFMKNHLHLKWAQSECSSVVKFICYIQEPEDRQLSSSVENKLMPSVGRYTQLKVGCLGDWLHTVHVWRVSVCGLIQS